MQELAFESVEYTSILKLYPMASAKFHTRGIEGSNQTIVRYMNTTQQR